MKYIKKIIYGLVLCIGLNSSVHIYASSFNAPNYIQNVIFGMLFQTSINRIFSGAFNIQNVVLSTTLSQSIGFLGIKSSIAQLPSHLPYVGNFLVNISSNRLILGNYNVYQTLKNVAAGIIFQKILQKSKEYSNSNDSSQNTKKSAAPVAQVNTSQNSSAQPTIIQKKLINPLNKNPNNTALLQK